MSDQDEDLSWLGAEALPGDLAEINRVNQAKDFAAARHQRSGEGRAESRHSVASAMRWLQTCWSSGF
ncbi:MAG: hypothetical protein HY017_09660 [Betaproteobacteria bacterium]|nr:hypothetical protein [Betaproteobacteria bacterium]